MVEQFNAWPNGHDYALLRREPEQHQGARALLGDITLAECVRSKVRTPGLPLPVLCATAASAVL